MLERLREAVRRLVRLASELNNYEVHTPTHPGTAGAAGSHAKMYLSKHPQSLSASWMMDVRWKVVYYLR